MTHRDSFWGEEFVRKLFAFAAVATLLSAQPALAEIGRIKSHVGPVSIQRGGSMIAAKPGQTL